jgi:two-component system chemotaxis sensor kinase CheA
MSNTTDDDFLAEALPAFVSEAHEQLDAVEQLLLQLESAPDDRGLLDALFRSAHTVKGSAGLFGLDATVAFTHHLETLLDQLREGHVRLSPELGTLLLQANDAVRGLVRAAESGSDANAPGAAERDALVQRMQLAAGTAASASAPAAAAAAAPAPGPVGGWKVRAAFGAETFRNGLDPLALMNYVGRLGEMQPARLERSRIPPLEALDPEACHLSLEFVLHTAEPRDAVEQAFSFVRDDCELSIEPLAPAAAARAETASKQRAAAAPAQPAGEDRFIRVHADRLDAVINLLGELVIAGAGASMLARRSGQSALMEANLQISRLVEEIRNGTLQLRMVAIGETFSRLRRVVRDIASGLGKDVALEISGADTELDKSVVERVADPLMHLVRNALDHGLETPEERVAAGKPAQGRLLLSACHESGSIRIRIEDDGRGIDRHKVLQRARERGLVAEGATLSEADVLGLIFQPGFSTAEAVTNLSGRGVGMDVVRSNIEALRGTVTVASTPGHGTSIDIRLPLTLAIIDGFLVAVGPSKFIFPLDAVLEVIEGEAMPAESASGCVTVRGALLPVLNLRSTYGLDSPAPERGSIVVLREGSRRFGVLVDTLLGQHQTVIKPLGKMLRSLRGISGSSILGNGEVALIFDAAALGQLAVQRGPHTNA